MNFTQFLLLMCVLLPIAAAPAVYLVHRRSEKAGHILTIAVLALVLAGSIAIIFSGAPSVILSRVFLLGIRFSARGIKSIFALLCAYLFFMAFTPHSIPSFTPVMRTRRSLLWSPSSGSSTSV